MSAPNGPPKDPVHGASRTEDLVEVGRGIARLAVPCRVRILERGVIGRVATADHASCATAHTAAFRRPRDPTMMPSAIRETAAGSFGPAQGEAREDRVIARRSCRDLDRWPAA
jgi:hypothetical protein